MFDKVKMYQYAVLLLTVLTTLTTLTMAKDAIVVFQADSGPEDLWRLSSGRASLEAFKDAFGSGSTLGQEIDVEGKFLAIMMHDVSLNTTEAIKGFPGVKGVSNDDPITLDGLCDDQQDSNGTRLWNLDHLDDATTYDSVYRHTASQGAGVVVYVVDTGVETDHPDFNSPQRWEAGYCTYGCDNSPVWKDGHGHGTHVAGTVLGNTYGVAKSATLVPIKVFADNGGTSTSAILLGLFKAYTDIQSRGPGAKGVINMSLGGPPNEAFDDMVNTLVDRGMVVVVAAGNEYAYNACYRSPARAFSAITVGATTIFRVPASFSNGGDCVDVWAPGQTISSACHGSFTTDCVFSGTSMSSPLVAGLAARLITLYPAATPWQIWQRLMQRADMAITDPYSGEPNKPLVQLPCTEPTNPLPPIPLPPGCVRTVEVTDIPGTITSPNFPQNYDNSESCAWTLVPPSGAYLRIFFPFFELEGFSPICPFDYVLINGTKYCSTTGPDVIEGAVDEQMVVTFTTDSSVTRKGFVMVHSAHTTPGSGGSTRTCPACSTCPKCSFFDAIRDFLSNPVEGTSSLLGGSI